MASITLQRSGIQLKTLKLAKARTTLGGAVAADIELCDPNLPPILAEVRAEGGRHRVIATRGYLLGVAGELVEEALLEDGEEVSLGSFGFTYQREAEVTQGSEGGGELQSCGGLISRDPRMHRLFALIRKTAALDVPVLIGGETGTGKELVADAVHRLSKRAGGAFIALNAGGMATELIASELFGHVAGAFTGATGDSPGAFFCAEGGSLFLDEMGEMPLDAQAHLLRVLDKGEYRRVGADELRHANVRLIAATHRNLHKQIGLGLFRQDLLYRVSVARLELPALRQRRCDILLLWDQFVAQLGEGRRLALTARAQQKLLRHAWPGNVRELRNVVLRALVFAERDTLGPNDIQFDPLLLRTPEDLIDPQGLTLAEVERETILHALQHTGGNVEQAAAKLGVTRALLRRRLEAMERAKAARQPSGADGPAV